MKPVPKRTRPGTVALREIRYYQKSTELLIKRAQFRAVCADGLKANTDYYRLDVDALHALQVISESYLVGLFTDAQVVAIQVNRKTVRVEDLQLTRRLRGRESGGAANASSGHLSVPVPTCPSLKYGVRSL